MKNSFSKIGYFSKYCFEDISKFLNAWLIDRYVNFREIIYNNTYQYGR